MRLHFPPNFLWGTSTSAYQIEGAWDSDGKVPSVWDTYFREGGGTLDGSSGDVAIDHYHRYQEDFDLLADLGAPLYRLSVSWPRIITDAAGTVNEAGLDYYERVIDALLARGLKPAVNLYHWDTPQWAEDLGGWMSRDQANRFADYTQVITERLGDRVVQWYTANEPTHNTLGSYVAGVMPPRRKLGLEGFASVHHMLLAHGLAVQRIREIRTDATIGTILSLSGFEAATEHGSDQEAALRARHFEAVFTDPLLGRGHLPELGDLLDSQGVLLPGDEELIAQPLDVIGLNWYSRGSVASPERAAILNADLHERSGLGAVLSQATAPLGFSQVATPGAAWSGAHRQNTPGGLLLMLREFTERYPEHPRIIITENGIGGSERIEDGRIDDSHRIDYLHRCLRELHEALQDGIDVAGYCVWSSFDNLQWFAGFQHRFGLVHVDEHTLERTPKAAYHWYRQCVRDNAIDAEYVLPDLSGDSAGVQIDGVLNSRGIGGLRTIGGGIVRDGVVFRSASLDHITQVGLAELNQLGITTVIDLRDASEVPGNSIDHAGIERHHIPLLGIAIPEVLPQSLIELYTSIIQDSASLIVEAIRVVLRCRGAVLVHCAAGKDRTGLVIAVLLAAIDVPDVDIVRTYTQSAELLGPDFLERSTAQVQAMARALGVEDSGSLVEEFLQSPPEAIQAVLAHIRREYVSVQHYLRIHGLTAEEIHELRARLVEVRAAAEMAL